MACECALAAQRCSYSLSDIAIVGCKVPGGISGKVPGVSKRVIDCTDPFFVGFLHSQGYAGFVSR